MKKLLGIVVLALIFLNSCSEEKKQSKENKEENKYLKVSISKKLSKLDEIHMEEMMKKLMNDEIDDLSTLMMFYVGTGTKMLYCEAMAEIKLETDLNKKEEKYKQLYLKSAEEECKIYKEIYEKYNSIYLTIINTNSIPAYFYFKLKEEGSESSESIGIFPTKKECEYYSNLFRSKNIGLTSNCKKGFSPA
jgi:hypothetical protein